MTDSSYDLVVIGGGPGGYVAAIRAAQLCMNVACVEKRDAMGGTCLNVGCIPSKALLRSSELYAEAQHGLEEHGVKLGSVKLDLATMMARKDKVVSDLTGGIAFLLKKNKIDHFVGTGAIENATTVVVSGANGKSTKLATKNILIATGSESTPIPGIDIDEEQIVTSTGALAFKKVPKHLVVIGGGYIGLEMASIWGRLGADITCIEFLDRITPGMDSEVSKNFQRILKKQGMKFKLGTKVTAARKTRAGVTLTIEPAKGGESEQVKCDAVLVSVGRRPYTDGLGLDTIGVATDERGVIRIDAEFPDNRSRRLRHWRLRARPDAGAQGRRRRRGLRRNHRRAVRAHQLRRHPQRCLHLAGSRQRRQDRGTVERGGNRLQIRQIPFHCQQPRARQWGDRRVR